MIGNLFENVNHVRIIDLYVLRRTRDSRCNVMNLGTWTLGGFQTVLEKQAQS